ncbi:hypothetical protein [Gilliamella sp. Bim3-2]|uniref:hypothetical protein n=1 Tax=Gilliamella sp. Bim3-2 TaxID=3120235 RepID=UPI00159EF1B8|nr:hypothetical protein [Gilliamella apicola]
MLISAKLWFTSGNLIWIVDNERRLCGVNFRLFDKLIPNKSSVAVTLMTRSSKAK